jgi:hypothetical protein
LPAVCTVVSKVSKHLMEALGSCVGSACVYRSSVPLIKVLAVAGCDRAWSVSSCCLLEAYLRFPPLLCRTPALSWLDLSHTDSINLYESDYFVFRPRAGLSRRKNEGERLASLLVHHLGNQWLSGNPCARLAFFHPDVMPVCRGGPVSLTMRAGTRNFAPRVHFFSQNWGRSRAREGSIEFGEGENKCLSACTLLSLLAGDSPRLVC